MDRLFSWAQNPAHDNKWDRLALTKKGAFMIAQIHLNDDDEMYHAKVFNTLQDGVKLESEFKSLDEAKNFADRELKRQGF